MNSSKEELSYEQRRRKLAKPKKRIRNAVQGDVTLNDCANATNPVRLKKIMEHQPINLLSIETIKNSLNEIDDDSEIISIIEKPIVSNKNKPEDGEIEYKDYHIDIWFLISEYIRPEDTGRFALICKKTEAVICSARYWSNLYHRFYSSKLILPKRLRPREISRVHGLRGRVICSLFYTYTPFSMRLVSQKEQNLTNLENLQYVQSWYRRCADIWIYCYRFVLSKEQRRPLKYEQSDDDIVDDILDNLEHLEKQIIKFKNLFDNPKEGQHILLIQTQRFIPPPVFEQQDKITLSLIRRPLHKNNFDTGLEMTFSNYKNHEIGKIKYEVILNHKIISWWSPEFSLFEK